MSDVVLDMGFTLLAYEEQPITARGLAATLGDYPEVQVLGIHDSMQHLISAVLAREPDVVLLGQPPATRSVQPLLRQVLAVNPRLRLVAWAAEVNDLECVRALQAGAKCVITRSHPAAELLECLRAAAMGDVWIPRGQSARDMDEPARHGLSARELQVVELVARGCKNREIAAALNITTGTVKVHLSHIFEKTGMSDRFQLALRAHDLLVAKER